MGALIDRVAEQAERDPERIVPVLQALLGEEVEVPGRLRRVAQTVANARSQAVLSEFKDGALTTAEAARRLGVSSPQAVHQMRERGRLAGKTIGNRTYWPAWQFAEGGLREDLGDILEVIAGFTSDAVATDRIMRLPREEFAGRSIAEVLDEPDRAAAAWQILHRVGDGF